MFLSKIWFVLVGLLAGVAVTAAFVAPRPADRRIEQLEGQRMDRAQYAAEQLLKNDARRWIDYVAKLGTDGKLIDALDAASHGGELRPLHESVRNRLRELVPDPTSVESGYHTDTSWRLVPAWGAVLRAVTLPDVGGDTIWVDAHLAYENLPEELKARLEGLHVTHDFRRALNANGHDYPIVAHPIVRTHRETGEKILWVNYTQRPHIIGLDIAEGKELLNTILYHYKKPENQVRFSWRPGSLAFWDNRAAVHYAVRNYGDFPRLMQRILIADEPLYADL